MIFYISISIVLILILFLGIKLILLGPTLLKIKAKYVKYKNVIKYSYMFYFIGGILFVSWVYPIWRVVKIIPYEIGSSLFLWIGITYIYIGLKVSPTMYVKDKGIYHGIYIIKWKNIKECRFYSEYFVVEQKNRNILKFTIEQDKVDDFIKILSEKIDFDQTS